MASPVGPPSGAAMSSISDAGSALASSCSEFMLKLADAGSSGTVSVALMKSVK